MILKETHNKRYTKHEEALERLEEMIVKNGCVHILVEMQRRGWVDPRGMQRLAAIRLRQQEDARTQVRNDKEPISVSKKRQRLNMREMREHEQRQANKRHAQEMTSMPQQHATKHAKITEEHQSKLEALAATQASNQAALLRHVDEKVRLKALLRTSEDHKNLMA